jgi:predicted Zn-dependent protease with MMP-like domain
MPPDRHGRAGRADNDPRRRPSDGYRVTGARRFRRIAGDALTSLPERFTAALGGAQLVLDDVPPPPMTDANGDITLATFDGTTLTLYRRPLELRAENRGTLEETILIAAGQAIARRLGWDEDIEGLFDGGP